MDTLTQAERDALRERYKIERDKRIRPDGNDQYLQPTGRFANLLEDPHVEVVPRDPIREEVTVAIIGGGFAGLVTGARLKEAGIDDVRIIDKAGDAGGVWYWNRYPGAMCDTAAMIYLPLLEETGTVPTMKYVSAPEIFAHARRIATTFGLYEKALFSTGITSVTWSENDSRWIICTDRGDELRARFVTVGTGPLHRPKLPGIPGIDAFAGHTFHTARWDYDYTGGTPDGAPMDRLADKRVGIIGTGATAIQCIPHLARSAKEFYVFQRTPSSIDVRNNQPIDPDWYRSLETGWQQKWLINFATLQTGGFAAEDLVKDGWTDIAQRIRDRVVEIMSSGAQMGPDTLRRAYEDSDDEKMCEIRERVDEIVGDPATAEALKPWYRQLCKRPCFSDEYLQAYNEPNTHLIDTDGHGVERIDETGVWAGGRHYGLDCLIFASGFEVGTEQSRRSGFNVVGRNGCTLTEHWAEGMRTMHGIHVHGFPNFFILGIGQGANLISNIPHNFVEAATTISAILRHALADGAEQVEVTADAEREWVELLETGEGRILGDPDCTPGYYNNEGRPIGRRERLNMIGYPGGPVAFFEYLNRWRSSGDFPGLEFHSKVPSK
jgi:cation diffusion facilitator CzcD-associated flavoprotein CzcO